MNSLVLQYRVWRAKRRIARRVVAYAGGTIRGGRGVART